MTRSCKRGYFLEKTVVTLPPPGIVPVVVRVALPAERLPVEVMGALSVLEAWLPYEVRV